MSATISTDQLELHDAHESVKVTLYLRRVWSRRSYIWYVALQELRARQVNNVLGNLWHLLNPALTIGVYYVIFGLLLKTTRGVDNFILFLTVGLFVFQAIQKATTDGAKAIVSNAGVIRSIQFPRAVLPATSTVTEMIGSLSTFGLMYAILLVGGERPRWTWLLFPILLAVLFMFNLGAAMIAARLTTHFRDTTQILPFFFRLLLYASGVIYNVDAYVENNPGANLLFTLNPAYCFITTARWMMLGNDFKMSVVVSAVTWSFAILTIGFLWFRNGEGQYGRD